MRILDKNWPWHFAAGFVFVGAMAGIKFMLTGFNEDFGWGFGVGAMTGTLIVMLAVGWQRGEMTRTEVLPPLAQKPQLDRETGDGWRNRSGTEQ